MNFRAFHPDDVTAMTPQSAQAALSPYFTREIAEAAALHFAQTGLDESGQVVGCAGVCEMEDGRLLAWAWFAAGFEKYALSIIKFMRWALGEIKDPVWAYVDSAHVKATRFAEALGFALESTERSAFPDGREALLYVRR